MITGLETTVRDIAKLIDAESKLPNAMISCSCGADLVTVVDYKVETVACKKCLRIASAGNRGATIQVERVTIDSKTGIAEYPTSKELDDKIIAAKAIPEESRTVAEKILAAVTIKAIAIGEKLP